MSEANMDTRATKRLRDALDKYGIKWSQGHEYDLMKDYVADCTLFDAWFTNWKAIDYGNGRMSLSTDFRTIKPDDIVDGLVDSYVSKYYRPRKNTILEAENAMLRELVETMHGYYASGTVEDCDLCKWNNECTFEHDGSCRYDDIREDAAKAYFASEFSKLGIEVDE